MGELWFVVSPLIAGAVICLGVAMKWICEATRRD